MPSCTPGGGGEVPAIAKGLCAQLPRPWKTAHGRGTVRQQGRGRTGFAANRRDAVCESRKHN